MAKWFLPWLAKRSPPAEKLPRSPPLRLDRDAPENAQQYVDAIPGLNFADHYIALAEVGASRHVVILNLTTGQILPGMFHLTRFQIIPEEDF